jgi:hypothetical protein
MATDQKIGHNHQPQPPRSSGDNDVYYISANRTEADEKFPPVRKEGAMLAVSDYLLGTALGFLVLPGLSELYGRTFSTVMQRFGMWYTTRIKTNSAV